jgi:hypothetical protein
MVADDCVWKSSITNSAISRTGLHLRPLGFLRPGRQIPWRPWPEHRFHPQRLNIQAMGLLDSCGSEVRHVLNLPKPDTARRPIFQYRRPQGMYRTCHRLHVCRHPSPGLVCVPAEERRPSRRRVAEQLLGRSVRSALPLAHNGVLASSNPACRPDTDSLTLSLAISALAGGIRTVTLLDDGSVFAGCLTRLSPIRGH